MEIMEVCCPFDAKRTIGAKMSVRGTHGNVSTIDPTIGEVRSS